MTNANRRELTAIMLSRASELAKDDWAAELALGLLAESFIKSDRLYDDEFALSGDHTLNAVLDDSALTVAEYILRACGYQGIADRMAPTRKKASDKAHAAVNSAVV